MTEPNVETVQTETPAVEGTTATDAVADTAVAAEGEGTAAPENAEAAAAAAADKLAAEKAAAEAEAAERADAERKARIDASVKKARARMRAQAQARAEADQLRQQLAFERAERVRLAELAKAYENEDPLALLEKRGVTPEKIAQRIIQKGTPEEKLSLLEQKLAQQEQTYAQKLEQIERQRQQQEFQAKEEAARSFVVSTSAKNADRHELLLARFGSEEGIVAEVFRTAKAAHERSGGRYAYPAEEILEHLEEETRSLVDRLTKTGSKKQAGQPESKVAGNVGNAGSTPAKAPAKTLSNGTATDSFTLPPDLDRLPEQKQNELLAEYFRRLQSAGAA